MRFSISTAVVALLGLASAMPQKHTARQHRFKRFETMAKYVAAASNPTCPNPPHGAKVFHQINQPSTDTQAYIFVDHRKRHIIFASPGSASSEDYAIDAQVNQVPYSHCSGCYVHQGFYAAWKSIEHEAHDAIKRAKHRHPKYKVISTGYSLGAAIAAMAWTDLRHNGIHVHSLYTFGQPRIGNPAFAGYMDQISGANENKIGGYFRVIHAADPVPNWPSGPEWRHPLTQYWEETKYSQDAQNTWRCYGQEPADCALSLELSAPDINDHFLYSNVLFTNPGPYCS